MFEGRDRQGLHDERRGGGGAMLEQYLKEPEDQVIFIGSVNCLRHKPFTQIGEYMRRGRAAILCPSMSDFSSGRYLGQLEEAVLELSEERNSKSFTVITGCQWTILSTDGDLLAKQLKNGHGIELTIVDDNHLTHGDHD